MNVGSLIQTLKACKQDAECRFIAPSRCYPNRIRSYRGDYSQVELEPGDAVKNVKDVVAMLEDAIGKIFEGYKGGEYRCDASTEVYASEWGELGLQITGVFMSDYCVYLQLTPYNL